MSPYKRDRLLAGGLLVAVPLAGWCSLVAIIVWAVR